MASILQQSPSRVRNLFEKLGLWVLGACYFLWPYHDAPTFLLAGKILISALFLFWLFTERPARPKLSDPALVLLFIGAAGFTLWAYVSSFWSLAPWRTFKHVTEEVLLNLMAFGLAAIWAAKASPPALERMKKVVLASFLWVLFLYAFFYVWWLVKGTPLWPVEEAPKGAVDPISLLFLLPDWHDVLLNRQNLANYLLFPSSMALAYLICARDRRQLLQSLFWFSLFFGVLFLTSKRSALLGLMIGGVIAVILAKRFRLFLFLLALMMGLVSLVVFTPLKRYFVRENFRLFLEGKRSQWFQAGSIPMRYYGLPYFLRYIREHPWKGIGYGRFNIKLNPETRALVKEAHLAHAHNVWINLALHLGIPGLVFFLIFLAGEFLCFWRLFKRAGPGHWLALGFLIYFIAFWVRHQFDDSFRYATSALYFLNTGLGVGLSFRKTEP